MKKNVITAKDLTVRYEGSSVAVQALDRVSFEVNAEEFIVVLGPSGSGKSTLLNVVGGMDRATLGELYYEGAKVSGYTPAQLSGYRRDVIGFVFQFFHLIPSLTALENVELAADMGVDSMNPKEVLEMAGLSGRENHFPSQMSGGEQQRVAIARAIVKKPKLLLCDEPTGALDSKNSQMIIRLILYMAKYLKCPVLMITHNSEIARAADRVFYMKDGRIERIETNEAPVPVEQLEF